VTAPLLEVSGLAKAFGGVRAVDGCTLSVPAGGITGLIGPNGSGKTTLFDLVTGYQRPDAGRVVFGGRDVTRWSSGRLYRHGLSRTFQQPRVFLRLSALENVVAAGGQRWWQLAYRRVRRAEHDVAHALLGEFGLAAVASEPAGELSYGQRKLLEFAAVLMTEPKLVLLDEPTAGVNPTLAAAMERHIRARHAAGTTFLVVEHDMGVVMRLCDPVIVLDAGRPLFTGPPAEVQRHPAVLDAYLGD
jgi:ABC-type branched-subunit amino acid transport system ATPase component